MFPKSEEHWIEESMDSSEQNIINMSKDFLVKPEKIFYYIDSEDIAFRIKLNYLLINSNPILAENKIWGINVKDSSSSKILFSLQLNDTSEDCTIELLDENKVLKASLKGKLSEPEKEDDNIKIAIIPEKKSDDAKIYFGSTVYFFIDFKFPIKLLFNHLPHLAKKDLDCNLSYYILNKEKTALKETNLVVANRSSKNHSSANDIPSLDYINLLVKNTNEVEIPLPTI